MSDLRHRIVVAGHLPFERALGELTLVAGDVTRIGIGEAFRRPFLHLVGAYVDRLYEAPLESAGAAVSTRSVLDLPDARDVSARWAVAGGAGLLVVDAKIGVVGQEVELVAQRLDDGAAQVP